jgi:hypothetical protein
MFCSLAIVVVFLVRRPMSVVLIMTYRIVFKVFLILYATPLLQAALSHLDTFYPVRLEWVGQTIKTPRMFKDFAPEIKLCGCCE